MPMQPADALQQHIHWREIGDQQIGVDIETLFERLGADQDERPRRPLVADLPLHRTIEPAPIHAGEPPVMQCRDAVEPEERRMIRRKCMQGTGRRHRIPHEIADDQHFCAALCCREC